MIVIVGFDTDPHVREVRQHLTVPSVLIDTSWFPAALGIEVAQSSGSGRARLSLPDGSRLDLAEVRAVWYRRIRPLGLDPAVTDEAAKLFAWSEANEALLGLWYSLDCFWMNPPLSDDVALRKIRQLQVAARVGLTIPETLVTNEPAAALDFIRQYEPGGVIRKAFRNIQEAPRTTAIVGEPDLSLIGLVRYTPVIFQRFVPARLDLRVTIVDGEVFAAAIESGPEFQADYRTGLASARVTPYELPSLVTERLMKMMDVFNLSYGAIDLRVTPDGEHVFLEVNPAGEYRFISERTGQPISAAIAAALARHAEGTTEAAFSGRGPHAR